MNCTSADRLKLSSTEALILESLKISYLSTSEILEYLNKRHVLISFTYLWEVLRSLEEKNLIIVDLKPVDKRSNLYKYKELNQHELH